MPARKSKHLRDMYGTYRADREGPPLKKGSGLRKPAYLKGRPAAIWKEIAAHCTWLERSHSGLLAMYCDLLAESEDGVATMPASKIAQARALAGDLGLVERAKALQRQQADQADDEDPEDAYLARKYLGPRRIAENEDDPAAEFFD